MQIFATIGECNVNSLLVEKDVERNDVKLGVLHHDLWGDGRLCTQPISTIVYPTAI